MKLNVGDLVELLYDGTTFSGVITSVTPERVELSFVLNIFVEGPGKLTWPNGVESDVDVGANALTKLHLRMPLEEVARAYATGGPIEIPGPAKVRHPTRKSKTRDLLEEAGAESLSSAATSPGVAPAPPVPPAPRVAPAPRVPPPHADAELSLEDLMTQGGVGSGVAPEVGDLEALLAELGQTDQDLEGPPDGGAQSAPAALPAEPRKRDGVWVAYEALVDGVNLANSELFPASLLLVSSTGCLVRSMGDIAVGDRIQLRFTLGRDSFDLSSTVVHEEGPQVYEVAYDVLPSEVRVRMLRAVLGLAKPEMRTQESWTYKLRQKGSG